jgi:hypothetical protein
MTVYVMDDRGLIPVMLQFFFQESFFFSAQSPHRPGAHTVQLMCIGSKATEAWYWSGIAELYLHCRIYAHGILSNSMEISSFKTLPIVQLFRNFLAFYGTRSKITLKNSVFWDVTPQGSCKNRRFGGTYRLLHQGDTNRWTRKSASCN